MKRFPNTAYVELVKALQYEWTYLQRVATGHRSLYEPIKKAIREDFLPIFLGQPNVGETLHNQIALVVKRERLGIQDTTMSTADNHTAYMECCNLLVESLMSGVPLDIKDHQRHATNSNKNYKEHRKAKELRQLAQLKQGVNNSASQ